VFFLSVGLDREGFILDFDATAEVEEAVLVLEEAEALENRLLLVVGELVLDRLANVERTGIRGP
jgi:hypothetical protein